MNRSIQEEFDELVVYVAGLKKTFNRKLDDHLFIIQQQNQRLDDQNRLIDELAWQVRDLRSSVRQVSDKLKERERSANAKCDCAYANCKVDGGVVNKKLVISSGERFSTVVIPEEDEEEEEDDDDNYEPVHFNTSKPRDYVPTPAQRSTKLSSSSSSSISSQYRNEQKDKHPSPNPYGKVHRSPQNSATQINYNNFMANYYDEKDDEFEEIETNDDILRQKEYQVPHGSLCNLMTDNLEEQYMPEQQELDDENFIRISRTIQSDAVVDYRISENFAAKRQAFMAPQSNK